MFYLKIFQYSDHNMSPGSKFFKTSLLYTTATYKFGCDAATYWPIVIFSIICAKITKEWEKVF